jgi:hypothetical protein
VKLFAVLLGALLLFAAGYAVATARTAAVLEIQRLRTDSVLQVVTVQHLRARDSLEALGRHARARADSAERAAADRRRVAALLKSRADSLTAALAVQVTAADSLPLVLDQRDQALAAYETLARGFDSLHVSNDFFRTAVAASDSARALAAREAAVREAALRALNDGLRLDLERARSRSRLLGLVRVPDGVKVLAGAVLGYCVARGCR